MRLAGASVGFRSDYSSAFGAGSKPFTFPRADGYFRLSGLDFWDNTGISKTILDFKLRLHGDRPVFSHRHLIVIKTLSRHVFLEQGHHFTSCCPNNANLMWRFPKNLNSVQTFHLIWLKR